VALRERLERHALAFDGSGKRRHQIAAAESLF
jgi:hypothetical protein